VSVEATAALIIVLMALVTYACRAAGYVVIRAARPGPRLERFLQSSPKTMFVALATMPLVHGGAAEWLGGAAAVAVMAMTRNLLVSITVATATVAVTRAF